MLPWWAWLLLWAVLVLGGGLWIALRARATWRSATALGAEVARAGDVLAELETHLDAVGEPEIRPSDVTRDPREVWADRERVRAARRAERYARREARRPPWARHVH